jgi:hypothetical protein
MHVLCTNTTYWTKQLAHKDRYNGVFEPYCAVSCAITWHQWHDE